MAGDDILSIDGAEGEGGGQVLRSALSLAMLSGQPFRMENIRAGRHKPGLMRQHLTAVRAACALCRGAVNGDAVGSRYLEFFPGEVRPGRYEFAVGTAGSTTLVLQTLLYPLLSASGPSEIVIEGGTHNPLAPPFEFLAGVFAPLIRRMGPGLELSLERHGFAPAGGGRLRAMITPVTRLRGLHLTERGTIVHREARVYAPGLPGHVAQRELLRVSERLGWPRTTWRQEKLPDERGPANLLLLGVASDTTAELVGSFGRRGLPAEAVADRAVDALRRYLKADVPVGEHLADQLLLPLALAGEGEFLSLAPSRHTLTHAALIQRFLPVRVVMEDRGEDRSLIRMQT